MISLFSWEKLSLEKLSNFYLFLILCFFKDFIYLFLERGEGRETERERNINVWLPFARPLLGTWPETQGMCPDWELNRRPFGSQAGTWSSEPCQPQKLSNF